jgi:hypothetical protein
MKSSLLSSLSFPALPVGYYSTAPIYFEPMRGGGERLTVAGIVKNKNESLVKRLISPEIAQALYGTKQGNSFIALIDMALSQLNQQSLADIDLNDVKFPVDGMEVGNVIDTYADNANHALQQIATLHASLCKLSALSALDDDDNVLLNTDNSLDAWIKQIRNETLSIYPKFGNCFNKKILIAKGDEAKFDFVNESTVINFGLIIPSSLSKRVNNAKMKLWNLEHLPKEYQTRKLILGTSSNDSPDMADSVVRNKVNDSIESLQEQAERSHIAIEMGCNASSVSKMLAYG